MVTDMKQHLLIFRLHPAVCFSIAPLSNTISAAWLFPRIEGKRRKQPAIETFEAGLFRNLFPP
jgi:hypothetical protein